MADIFYTNIHGVQGSTVCLALCSGTYAPVNGSCLPCDSTLSHCLECSSSTMCTKCKSGGFVLSPLNTSVICKCPLRYFLNSSSGRCTDLCLPDEYLRSDGICDKICLEGTFQNASTLICDRCSQGCQICSNSTECASCKEGFFMRTVDNLCYAACLLGTYPNDTTRTC